MLYVLLLGMLHAACDLSFHEALCFIFHASGHVARGMIIVMPSCFIPCAFPNYRGCQAWNSVDKCWHYWNAFTEEEGRPDQGNMNHVSCFMELLSHVSCYVGCHASCLIPYHKLSTSRFMLHLMLHVMTYVLLHVVLASSCDVACPHHVLSLIHIWRCRRYAVCRSRWSPYH